MIDAMPTKDNDRNRDPLPTHLDDLPDLSSYDQVGAFLGVHPRTVRRMVRDETLAVVYVSPQRPRIPKDAIRRYLRERSR